MAKAETSTSPANKPGEGQNTAMNAGAAGIAPGADSGAGDGATGDDEHLPEMVQPILVRSVAAKGRWRIGRHFTQEPVRLDASKLDDDQKALLAADPELIIQADD